MPTGDLTPIVVWGGLAALAGFTALFIKDVVADLRKRLDASDARVTGLTKAVEDLTDVIKDGFRGAPR